MTDELLEEAINGISSGGAICFLGAGFSRDATDGYGIGVPSAAKLAEEIYDLIGASEDEDASLADLADYCHNDSELAPKLNELLARRLTVCDASDNQKKFFPCHGDRFLQQISTTL